MLIRDGVRNDRSYQKVVAGAPRRSAEEISAVKARLAAMQ